MLCNEESIEERGPEVTGGIGDCYYNGAHPCVEIRLREKEREREREKRRSHVPIIDRRCVFSLCLEGQVEQSVNPEGLV